MANTKQWRYGARRGDDISGVVATAAHPVVNRRRRKRGAVRLHWVCDGTDEIIELRPGDSIRSYLRLSRFSGDGIESHDVMESTLTLLKD